MPLPPYRHKSGRGGGGTAPQNFRSQKEGASKEMNEAADSGYDETTTAKYFSIPMLF